MPLLVPLFEVLQRFLFPNSEDKAEATAFYVQFVSLTKQEILDCLFLDVKLILSDDSFFHYMETVSLCKV